MPAAAEASNRVFRKIAGVESELSSDSFASCVSSNPKRHFDNSAPGRTSQVIILAFVALVLLTGLALLLRPRAAQRPAITAGQPVSTNQSTPPAPTPGPLVPAVASARPPETQDSTPAGPQRAAELVNQGTELFQQGQFDAAAARYAAALKLTPDDETVHFNLGLAQARLGRTAEATQSYLEALRLFPDYAEAHNNLGNLLAKEGKLAEAAEHLRAALALTPESASAQNNFGTLLVKQGKLEEAVKHYAEAVRLMPDYVEAHSNLGHAYVTQGKLEQAAAEFEAALRLKPNFEPALRGMARLQQKRQPLPPATKSPDP